MSRRPTLKDVSAAIAHPIALLGYCRDAAGTHGVRGSVHTAGRPVKLADMSELERLTVAIARARAARDACTLLEAQLVERREWLEARSAGTSGAAGDRAA